MTPRRVLDGIVLCLGLWMAISAPFLFPQGYSLALGGLIFLGLVVAGFALWGETNTGILAPEIINMVLGGLLFLSPWVFDFADLMLPTLNAWIVGIAMVLFELIALTRHFIDNAPGKLT
ncbi:MAG: SPW repeat protein [Deltaproteobacteria bacterium]|nr:SPW repeat protein [Deltaproteobacteria bacterium]